MSAAPGLVAFKLAYQLSPIVLTGGIAGFIPGGMLPIISLTESMNFVTGLLSGAADLGLDDYFANFEPMPGGKLINQDFGRYPFANQIVAANSTIKQPLVISMKMTCPIRGAGAYGTKLATLTALQAALDQHNSSGGTYTVATPGFFYTNCLLRDMTDISPGPAGDKQVQSIWQLNFEQPLLTQSQAAAAQNSMMQKVSSGLPTDGSLSGLSQTVGAPPSLATPSLAPAAQYSPAAAVAQGIAAL